MATTEKEVLLRGGNTDGEVDNNFEALAGAGNLKKMIWHEETGVDLASIADGDEAATDVTVTGVGLGDIVLGVSFSIDVADLVIDAHVTAADTVTVVAANNTGGAVNLASATVRLLVATLR